MDDIWDAYEAIRSELASTGDLGLALDALAQWRDHILAWRPEPIV